ncbi:MAG TPA: DUF433 domain-containing protein [Balneolales bacterium]|nr:DUF433 domain-containing protein [Balneolales bacterium]
MPTEIIHPYITREKGVGHSKSLIRGTRTRVINIIVYHKLGYTPEELAREFPHLSLSQIYDALSYYYENMTQIDSEIDNEKEENLINLVK